MWIASSLLPWPLCCSLFSLISGLRSLFRRLSKPVSLNVVAFKLLSTKLVIPDLPYIWLGLCEEGVAGLALVCVAGELVIDDLSGVAIAACVLIWGLFWDTWPLGESGGGTGWCRGVGSGLDEGSGTSPGRLSQSESLSTSSFFFGWYWNWTHKVSLNVVQSCTLNITRASQYVPSFSDEMAEKKYKCTCTSDSLKSSNINCYSKAAITMLTCGFITLFPEK